eukprot:5239661-Prorocentrum_lima.AAC.1
MFQSKVAEHILLGCGRGSLHPELLLEWTIHLLTCVAGVIHHTGPAQHAAAVPASQTYGTPDIPQTFPT